MVNSKKLEQKIELKTLILCSGGLDSSVCLALAVKMYGAGRVLALSAFYGQKHYKELVAADKISKYYKVKNIRMDLSYIFDNVSDCALISGSSVKIEKGSYSEQKSRLGKIPNTYVPFRNGVFISLATSYAISNGCEQICYGAHLDDLKRESAYPDCSKFFYSAIADAIRIGSNRKLEVVAPFIDKSKSEIVKEGMKINFPFELTWSCYEGKEKACGKCGTCLDRKLAFAENGIVDPIEYDI